VQKIMSRPVGTPAGSGLLQAEHFQMAYVTGDVERARDVLRTRYGVRNFAPLHATMPAGGRVHIELAWTGGIMIELIEATGPGAEFYNDMLPATGFSLRHHHLGYLVRDRVAWEALITTIEDEAYPIAYEGQREGFLRFCYIKAPEFDHYLEYLLLEPAGVRFFENVPAN
jgi:Glyoxalase/Bleomycin resistance protein/Dioxygenase superfamily